MSAAKRESLQAESRRLQTASFTLKVRIPDGGIALDFLAFRHWNAHLGLKRKTVGDFPWSTI